MRRIISMITIAALLSVSSVPLLPKAAICHAAEANTGCETCHTDAQGSADMNHEMHGMDHHHGMHDGNSHHQMAQAETVNKPEQMHSHKKPLSAAEKECRLECGCGCNHSVDGMPHLLAPHVATTLQFETGEQIARAEPAAYPAFQAVTLNNPPPPPRSI